MVWQEVEASELKMRLDEALSLQRQAAARENEQQGYWQVQRGVMPRDACNCN